MDKKTLEKAKELENYIKIIDNYLTKFNPNYWVVWLQVRDQYGNMGSLLDLYAHSNMGTDNNSALGYSINLAENYKEFLEKCTKDLKNRKEELQIQLDKL